MDFGRYGKAGYQLTVGSCSGDRIFHGGRRSAFFHFGGHEDGFLERFVGFLAAAEKILAIANDRDHFNVRRAHGICQRIGDRAIHLHVVLAKRRNLERVQGTEGI
jgi:hypothetical protein